MKPLLLILFAVLVLGGAGVGGYLYFHQPAEAASDGTAKVEKAHKKSGKNHGKEATYVVLEPLILPILDAGGVSQSVSIVVTLAVANKKAAKEVQYMAPRLTDAYIRNMYGMLNQRVVKRGILPVEIIRERLNSISDDVVGEGLIEEVLLQVVQQRPI